MANAQLLPISRVATGVYGLNLQAASTLLPAQWATRADNMVFNNQGILTSRYGWGSPLNSTAIPGSPAIRQIFEYVPVSGTNAVISTGGNHIYSGTTTLTDITGTVAPTADNWKFVNFNGYVYGLQTGNSLIQWNGSGNFTTVSATNGTVPNGNELLSAFGRLWGTDSTGQLLKYSLLLDATQWSTTGAGEFNLTSVWGTGNDSIVALAAFNNLLIVFGSKNIIIFQDSSGSSLGMNPTNMTVSDLIPGIGCVARDSVKNVNGEDLVFLSYSGVQSLKRVIIERSNATRNISINVRDSLVGAAQSEPHDNIKSSYNDVNGIYILAFPTNNAIYVFDTRVTLEDGSWRVTQWNNFFPTALCTLNDNTTLYAGYAGQIYEYGSLTGTTQDNGGSYTSSYESGWFDFGEELNTRLKVLKRLSSIFSSQISGQVTLKWQWDFSGTWSTVGYSYSTTPASQFDISQFGIDGFGGGAYGQSAAVPASGKGQYIKVGADFPINGNIFTLQNMELYAKVGRII